CVLQIFGDSQHLESGVKIVYSQPTAAGQFVESIEETCGCRVFIFECGGFEEDSQGFMSKRRAWQSQQLTKMLSQQPNIEELDAEKCLSFRERAAPQPICLHVGPSHEPGFLTRQTFARTAFQPIGKIVFPGIPCVIEEVKMVHQLAGSVGRCRWLNSSMLRFQT